MSSSKSSALVKGSSDSALMLPPPPRKRQKRPAKVLDEDVYSEALSHIIARDYFPGLLETQAQQEYMEALESKDHQWIRDAGRNLTQVMTPGPSSRQRAGRGTSFTPQIRPSQSATPRYFVGDTPLRIPTTAMNKDCTGEKDPDVDLSLSLGEFQAKFTSEDNESFNALLDRQNDKHAAKYSFFHNNRKTAARQITYHADENETSKGSNPSTLVVANAADELRTALSKSRPSQDLDLRQASVDSFPIKQGPRNSFMFGPNSVEDQVVTYQQKAEDVSNAPPKRIQYSATRFQTESRPDEVVPPSPSITAIEAAIAGRSMTTPTDLEYSGSETPRVNGYAFVDEEPTPSEIGIPVTDEEANAAELEAAKTYLPTLDNTGPSRFNIAERSKREDLHHRLVEKADAGRRQGRRHEQLQSLGITPKRNFTPTLHDKRGAGMTPAARRLAERLRSNDKNGDFFRSQSAGDTTPGAWTPTPRVKRTSRNVNG